MKIMKFSHDYPKLNDRLFTTLRKRDEWVEGEAVLVETPTRSFPARVIYAISTDLSQLSDELLCYDTGTVTRGEALALLSSFYRQPITEGCIMTLYLVLKE